MKDGELQALMAYCLQSTAETVEPLVEEMAEFIDALETLIAQSTATEF
ncbi:MAG: hypothetical protein KA314_10175 [Chloroflexi bacterium]|nr:hypothetical protein [Chloroflexota bacterium]MBP8056199.1 hypothetical protein [Chloroflexota bacterium]